MPPVEDKIHSRWNSTVDAIDVSRVFTGFAPPGTVQPYVTIRLDATELTTESNVSTFDDYPLIFTVHGEDFDAALAVAEGIFEGWNNQAFNIDSVTRVLGIKQNNLSYVMENTGMWTINVDLRATIQVTGCADADSSSSSGIVSPSSSSGIVSPSSSSSGIADTYEGFGASATGGTGGSTVYVTNLNDSGAGSFRQALADLDGTATIIKFSVSGNIELLSDLDVTKDNFTIDGSDAPNGGICTQDARLMFTGCDNFIVRHIRCRLGDIGYPGITWTNSSGLRCYLSTNFVLDHVSASFGTDGDIDVFRCDLYTVRYCLMGPILRDLAFPGRDGRQFMSSIGAGATEDGRGTIHRCLMVHASYRMPFVAGLTDVRNNVVYNAVSNAPTIVGNNPKDGRNAATDTNMINNYLKEGPDSIGAPAIRFNDEVGFYRSGNVWDDAGTYYSIHAGAVESGTEFDYPDVTTLSAAAAYADVLANVGATLPKRDSLDTDVVAQVLAGTGSIIESQTEVGGWPDLTV